MYATVSTLGLAGGIEFRASSRQARSSIRADNVPPPRGTDTLVRLIVVESPVGEEGSTFIFAPNEVTCMETDPAGRGRRFSRRVRRPAFRRRGRPGEQLRGRRGDCAQAPPQSSVVLMPQGLAELLRRRRRCRCSATNRVNSQKVSGRHRSTGAGQAEVLENRNSWGRQANHARRGQPPRRAGPAPAWGPHRTTTRSCHGLRASCLLVAPRPRFDVPRERGPPSSPRASNP